MHPILGSARRIGFYFAAWIPVCALLVSAMAPKPLRWAESVMLCVPLCCFYAFVCLSAWYLCRGLPIREENLVSLITAHVVNGLVGGGIWLLLARLIVAIMGVPAERLTGILAIVFQSGVMLYLLSVAIHYVVFAIEASQKARQRESEALILAGKAELRALRAQINPHFLYNSLNSISALTSVDPAKARQMCIQLSDFLRSTLGMSEQNSIPLRQEMELLRNYLAIEKVRFGKRLSIEESIDEACAEDPVPALILQPLVENAIVHGIAGMIESGVVHLGAEHRGDGKLLLVVENSFDPESKRSGQTGFGLAGIRKRLRAIYGQEASVQVIEADHHYRVELALPRI